MLLFLADLLLQIRGAAVMVKAIQTSSTTLCYCVHELAYHPDKQVQSKIL